MQASSSKELIELAAHPPRPDLGTFVRDCLFGAVGHGDFSAETRRLANAGPIVRADAETSLGNALDALQSLENAAAARLAAALVARSLADSPPQGVDAEDVTASNLVWLATHSQVDVLDILDEALGEKAGGIWGAVTDLIQRHDTGRPGLTRPEAIVAATALNSTKNPSATKRLAELIPTLTSPMLLSLLGAAGTDPGVAGEQEAFPRGGFVTFLLAVTGLLLVGRAGQLLARYALQLRRPAEVRTSKQGLILRSKTQLLGKTLRETETVIPFESVAKATRDVRYPRLPMYAGLTALAIGSYLGVSWFIDGIRAGSFSLATVGLLVVTAGIILDFVLVTLLPGRQGRCRVLITPQRGSRFCVGRVEIESADRMLQRLLRK